MFSFVFVTLVSPSLPALPTLLTGGNQLLDYFDENPKVGVMELRYKLGLQSVLRKLLVTLNPRKYNLLPSQILEGLGFTSSYDSCTPKFCELQFGHVYTIATIKIQTTLGLDL